ncbi:hypothetical protein GQ600_13629 [Phytophthora cactorum]|nr:hypothetical protein GQ600_13629 [Phytophthora cactorum]
MRFAFERQNAVTLGNNTNNRIEASWKQLKDLVNSFMGVDECIAAIMGYQDQEEKKFIDALHKLTVVHNPKYYCEIQFLSRLVSEHDCELVCEQFDFALTAVANGIREQLSDLGIKEYKAALRALRDVATLFRHGEFDAVSSVTRQLEETSDHDNPNQPNMEPHASSPQPGMDDHSLGTIGRELGADCNGLSTQGNRLGNDGTRLGTGETQVAQTSSQTRPTLAENQPQSEGELHLTGENQAHAVNLEDSNDAFEIQSPPRSRGRPGQKPRAPTYNSTQGKLLHFKVFIFGKKPSVPIAHEIRKLPSSKPAMRLDEIVKKIVYGSHQGMHTKVLAYQRTHRGVSEVDLALESWNGWSTWILRHENNEFFVEADPQFPEKLKDIPILSSKVCHISHELNANCLILLNVVLQCTDESFGFGGEELVSDEVMGKILEVKFGEDSSVAVLDTAMLGITIDGHVTASRDLIREELAGLTNEKLLIPVNWNGNPGSRLWHGLFNYFL